jgi:hypothetical protein
MMGVSFFLIYMSKASSKEKKKFFWILASRLAAALGEGKQSDVGIFILARSLAMLEISDQRLDGIDGTKDHTNLN